MEQRKAEETASWATLTQGLFNRSLVAESEDNFFPSKAGQVMSTAPLRIQWGLILISRRFNLILIKREMKKDAE